MPLRIFMVPPSSMLTDHRPHGDGLVAFGFIRELGSRGHELHVAAATLDLQAPLPSNVHVYQPRGACARPPLARMSLMRRMRALYTRLARSEPFDVIHHLNPVEAGLSLAFADVSVPVVLGPYVPDWAPSGDGADAEVSASGLRMKRLVRAAEQSRATTAVLSTPAAASKLEPSVQRRLHVRELSPGIDERAWLPGAQGQGGKDVLFLANLEVRKGIHTLLDAFAELARELPDARLRVAGDGPGLDQVRRRIESTPGLSGVDLIGHLERDRVMAAMHACNVYCLPSYGEPFGMTALEAMACARPVVATDAGGVRHLVPDQGGRKVRPGDSSALAAALREVLTQPGLRRSMGEHNRRLVEQRYTWARVGERLEAVYAEAIAEPRRRNW